MSRALTYIVLFAVGTAIMNLIFLWGLESDRGEPVQETSPKENVLWIQEKVIIPSNSMWQRITRLFFIADGDESEARLFQDHLAYTLERAAADFIPRESDGVEKAELEMIKKEFEETPPKPEFIQEQVTLNPQKLIESMKTKSIIHLDRPEPVNTTYEFVVRDIERMSHNAMIHNDTGWVKILNMPTTGFHSFNHTVSDSIGNFRHVIPDHRIKECKELSYNISSLPRTSIIIIFHNEARSTLTRTIHAILERTPKLLLEEIIIVDDASTYPWLQEPLKLYLEHLPRTKLIRLESRQGLIRARTRGAEEAMGEVLFFVDAHTEVGYNWLPPLLARIKENREVLVYPAMDPINWENFNIWQAGDFYYGAFYWDLVFKYKNAPKDLLKKQAKNKVMPLPSPVMVGCGHAIERNYFFETGAYDTDMEIWGGENLEHAFRLWMCGGRVEVISCSRVGHVFKPSLPYSFMGDSRNIIQRNYIRIAEIWMDEYKDIFYASQSRISPVDLKSLNERKQIRSKLGCNSFDWYLKTVFPEMPIPPRNAWHYGEISNIKYNGKCIHLDRKLNKLVLVMCDDQEWTEHLFNLDHDHQFTFNNTCIMVDESMNLVLNHSLNPCSLSKQKWTREYRQIKVSINGEDPLCIVPKSNSLALTKCNITNPSHTWKFLYTFDFARNVSIVDIVNKTMTPPGKALYFGAMRNIRSLQCFHPFENADYDVKDCSTLHTYERITHYDTDGGLRYKDMCVKESPNQDIMLVYCYGENPIGIWDYEGSNGRMKVRGEDKCLKHDPLQEPKIRIVPCSNSDPFQRWSFDWKM